MGHSILWDFGTPLTGTPLTRSGHRGTPLTSRGIPRIYLWAAFGGRGTPLTGTPLTRSAPLGTP